MPAGFEQVGPLPFDFTNAVAGGLGEGVVGHQDPALGVGHENPLTALLKHRAGQGQFPGGCFAYRQGCAGGQMIANEDPADHGGHHADGAADQHGDPEGAANSVRAHQPGGQLHTHQPGSAGNRQLLVVGMAQTVARHQVEVVVENIAGEWFCAVEHEDTTAS